MLFLYRFQSKNELVHRMENVRLDVFVSHGGRFYKLQDSVHYASHGKFETGLDIA